MDCSKLSGLSDDLQQIGSARKTAIIDAELHQLHIDIADLRETMMQDAEIPPLVFIDGFNLSVVDNFKYLGSTISSNLSLDVEINDRIGKAATVMAKLNKRVWQNISLTMYTKRKVYQACVTGILLYGSETWTPYARQEAKLNSVHLR